MVTRVVVYDAQIRHLFDPGENAIEFTKDVIDSIIARAQFFEVPRGNAQSGRRRQGWRSLQDSHKSRGVLRRGPYGADGSAYNDAPHAEWVHNGTTGPIVPTRGRYLAVPVPPGTRVARLAQTSMRAQSGAFGGAYRSQAAPSVSRRGVILTPSVRGQQANPWLRRAGDRVVAETRAKPYYRNWSKGGTRLTGG
jgi:hypothetical protein